MKQACIHSALKSNQSEPGMLEVKGFKLNGKDITSDTFDLAEYEKAKNEEAYKLSQQMEQKLTSAQRIFIDANARMQFRLSEYPGKLNQTKTIANDAENILFYGQVRLDERNKLEPVKEGKGYLFHDKTFYAGYFAQNVFNGPGILACLDGRISIYCGFWVNDQLQGEGKLISDTGYSYKGNWADSLQDGYGEEIWPDGSMYKGDFKKGYKSGHGEFIWPGKQRYVGQFKRDDMHGYGTFEWEGGNKYEGQWKGNLMHGQGKYTWSDGTIYEGSYANGKKDGFGCLTESDQTRYEGNWKAGKRDGKGYYYTLSNQRISCIWQNDKLLSKPSL